MNDMTYDDFFALKDWINSLIAYKEYPSSATYRDNEIAEESVTKVLIIKSTQK